MAKHTGRGIAAIEYPTGMNQNGDPSQAWIKVKPDGRVDVFAGTSDIGNGSKTIQSQIVAETIGVPYDWITYDNSNTDSSPVCTGTFTPLRVTTLGAMRSTGRRLVVLIGPLPSIGLPSASTTRPSSASPTRSSFSPPAGSTR